MVFPFAERSTNEFYERSLQALLFSTPRGFAARSHVLARLASLAQIGELARRLGQTTALSSSPAGLAVKYQGDDCVSKG